DQDPEVRDPPRRAALSQLLDHPRAGELAAVFFDTGGHRRRGLEDRQPLRMLDGETTNRAVRTVDHLDVLPYTGDSRLYGSPSSTAWCAPAAWSTCRVVCVSRNRSSSDDSSRRRTAWQSAPGSTRTCAASAGKPLVTVHTCRSCTSTTCGSATIRRPTASGSISPGEPSMKIRVDSRRSAALDQKTSAATARLAIGSNRSQPVARTSAPATAVPAKAARSVATWRKTQHTFRLERLER